MSEKGEVRSNSLPGYALEWRPRMDSLQIKTLYKQVHLYAAKYCSGHGQSSRSGSPGPDLAASLIGDRQTDILTTTITLANAPRVNKALYFDSCMCNACFVTMKVPKNNSQILDAALTMSLVRLHFRLEILAPEQDMKGST